MLYTTRFPLICHEYSALVTVYLFTILPYILRSNVLVRWENVHYQGAELREYMAVPGFSLYWVDVRKQVLAIGVVAYIVTQRQPNGLPRGYTGAIPTEPFVSFSCCCELQLYGRCGVLINDSLSSF